VEAIRVVIRYIDGKVEKGFTQDFFPHKDRFHLQPESNGSGIPKEVLIKELKAVFFVRDFAGNPDYQERKNYLEGEKSQGRKVEVTFEDGEVLVGSTLGYDPNRLGFFLFPVDASSNNMRVFAVTAAVKGVRYF
jgi:hypothetical protein